MGQQTSSSIQQGNQSHQRLGVIRVYQAYDIVTEYENCIKAELKRALQSQRKYQKWLSQLRSIDTQQARDVIYLPEQFKYQSTGICGSSGNVILTFQYYPYVLKTQIKNRRKMSQYFEETQLWYLMYNLVEAGAILQKKNKKVGDIHSNNCLLNQNGQIKIITQYSLPNQTTNYDKIVQSPTNDAYLAPQQIDQTLLQKGIYPNVDTYKAQVYSIGITILQAATLQDCFYAYNRGPYRINKKKISEHLKVVKQKYGKRFNDCVNNMLQEQPKRRKSCLQFYKELYPYEQAILQLRPFNILQDVENSVQTRTNYNGFNENSIFNGQQFNNTTYNVNSNGFNIDRNNMNQKSYTNTFNNNSQGYVQNSTYNGYDQNKVSNRNKDSVNYFKYNNANENNYHKGQFSSTSIDYKYNK